MKKLIFILHLSLSFCCYAKEDPVITEFSNIQKLKGSVVPIKSIDLGEVVDMEIMDSLLVLNEMFSDKIYKVFNINTGKLLEKGINKGKGPNELIYPGRIHVLGKNKFAQYDRGRKQLDLFTVGGESFLQFSNALKVGPGGFEIYPVNDSVLLCTGIFEKGRYCLVDSKTGKSQVSGPYPDFQATSKLDDANLAMIYQPGITIKPDRKQFACFEGSAGYFEIIAITDLSTKRSCIKNYFGPGITMREGHAVNTRDNLYTFHSATSTNNYIYVIYAGKSREEFESECYAGDNLLVYNWQGKPLVNYKLDRSLKIMTLDKEKMIVYGFSTNPVTGEPEVIKYQLPKVTKDLLPFLLFRVRL
ncbi:MAG: BF3164 family lipoprotein [Prolixibacteraceae bacterium]